MRSLGVVLGGAMGLKHASLAYVSEVGVPEVHVAGRPPNKQTHCEGKLARPGRANVLDMTAHALMRVAARSGAYFF